jgi:hypothetical protein
MKEKEKMPAWAKWTLAFCILAIIVLIAYFVYEQRTKKLDAKVVEKKKIVREIDSLEAKRGKTTDFVSDNSTSLSKKSDSITKTVTHHEKTFIPDTTYDAMCETILSFRPN